MHRYISIIIALFMAVNLSSAQATIKKREVDGIAIGMSSKEVMRISSRPCTPYDNTKLGDMRLLCKGGDGKSGIIIELDSKKSPPLVSRVLFFFCSKSTLNELAKSVEAYHDDKLLMNVDGTYLDMDADVYLRVEGAQKIAGCGAENYYMVDMGDRDKLEQKRRQ